MFKNLIFIATLLITKNIFAQDIQKNICDEIKKTYPDSYELFRIDGGNDYFNGTFTHNGKMYLVKGNQIVETQNKNAPLFYEDKKSFQIFSPLKIQNTLYYLADRNYRGYLIGIDLTSQKEVFSFLLPRPANKVWGRQSELYLISNDEVVFITSDGAHKLNLTSKQVTSFIKERGTSFEKSFFDKEKGFYIVVKGPDRWNGDEYQSKVKVILIDTNTLKVQKEIIPYFQTKNFEQLPTTIMVKKDMLLLPFIGGSYLVNLNNPKIETLNKFSNIVHFISFKDLNNFQAVFVNYDKQPTKVLSCLMGLEFNNTSNFN